MSYDRMYSHSQKKYSFVDDLYPGNVKTVEGWVSKGQDC